MPELVALDLAGRPGLRRGPPGRLGRRGRRRSHSIPGSRRRPCPGYSRSSAALGRDRRLGPASTRRGVGPPSPGTPWWWPPAAPPVGPRASSSTTPRSSASARATSARLGVDPGPDRWVACLPLAHVGGLSVVTRALVTGTPCTVLPEFDAAAVERQAEEGATLISLVATALRRTDASGLPRRAAGRGRAARLAARQRRHHLRHDRDGLGHRLRRAAPRRGGAPHRRRVHRPRTGRSWCAGPMLLRCYRDGTDPRLERRVAAHRRLRPASGLTAHCPCSGASPR